MKVALVHDWLIHMRGGEKVLECMAEVYPDATIYTLFYDRDKLSPSLQRMKIKASFLQRLPGIKKYYRWLLPILPWVIRTMKVTDVDVVLSTSHCVAKGIPRPPSARHVCYCHAPMRYAWGFQDEYFGKFPFFLRPLIKYLLLSLRRWDLKMNPNVDYFIANSANVQKRIRDFYGRESAVLYPPLDRGAYEPCKEPTDDYYLVVSAFVPYKRVDLVIEAFNELPYTLKVIGAGPLDQKYRAAAKRSTIEFSGAVSDEALKTAYANAKATIFPTEEDFGIVPLESQACGTPVIALGKGGALESVKTGIFFNEQTSGAICEAVREFESRDISREGIAEKVESFGRDYFKRGLVEMMQRHTSKKENYERCKV